MLQANISTYIDLLPQNSNLTSDEKYQASVGLATAYESVYSVVLQLDEAYEDQRTSAFNWDRFKRKVGSVIVHIAVGAVVVGVVAYIIVATGGAGAALLEPLIITLGAWTIEAVSATAVIGGAAGMLVGIGTAWANQCLVIPTLATIHYESC